MASSGTGSIPHLAIEQLMDSTGAKLLHVPYKGAAPAITDLMGGQVGRLLRRRSRPDRPCAVAASSRPSALPPSKRHPSLPDVKTLEEQGIKGVDTNNWYAFFASAKTPPATVESLNKAVRNDLSNPAVRDKLLATGAEPAPSTPQELAALLKQDTDKWGKLDPGQEHQGGVMSTDRHSRPSRAARHTPRTGRSREPHPGRARPRLAALPGAAEQRADRGGLGTHAHRRAQSDRRAGRLARADDPARGCAQRSELRVRCPCSPRRAGRRQRGEDRGRTRCPLLPAVFAPLEQLVLELTDAMTRDIVVPDALMERVREHFDPKGIVEVVATVAAYNMVSRLLVALNVEH